MLTIKPYIFVLLAGLLLTFPAWSVTQAGKSISEQPVCLFYTETANNQAGYAVSDEGGVMFGSAFQQWGLDKVGYPISLRYERDGVVTQAFQKMIMEWRPELNSVVPVNIFDDLHHAGHDQGLLQTRQIPEPLPPGWDGDILFDEMVKKRQALLNERPALREVYFASNDPLTFYGLPTSEIYDMGNHYAIRLQRAVLQEWKEDVPWAKAGEVTIANGGDIAKELGVLPPEALAPIGKSPCSSSAVPSPAADQPAATTPAATSDSSPNVCTSDMALLDVSHGLAEEVNIILEEGPQISWIIVPSRETKSYCVKAGSYKFRALAFISGQERGDKTFTSGNCQCWRLYSFMPDESCSCSNNLADYQPLPNLKADKIHIYVR